MEFRNGIPVVKRKVAFLTKQGLAVVTDLVIPCDKGNHLAPQFPLTCNFMGKQFRFLRDSHEPQKRPMYEEIELERTEPTKDDLLNKIEEYESALEVQEKFASFLVNSMYSIEKPKMPIDQYRKAVISTFNELQLSE